MRVARRGAGDTQRTAHESGGDGAGARVGGGARGLAGGHALEHGRHAGGRSLTDYFVAASGNLARVFWPKFERRRRAD